MIANVWIVTKIEGGFLARQHKQGHDGLNWITPGFTEARIERPTLEAMHEALAAENVQVSVSERIRDAFRVNTAPDAIEVWY